MAEQITIEADADAFLSSYNPSINGASQYLSLGYNATKVVEKNRPVLRFPTAGIPAHARLLGVGLWAYVYSAAASAETCFWARIPTDRDWVEMECWWNDKRTSVAWTGPGGDYSYLDNGAQFAQPTATGDTLLDDSADLLEELEFAIAGDGNVHMLMKRASEIAPNSHCILASRENAAYDGPRLIVDYVPRSVHLVGCVQLIGNTVVAG